MNRKKLPLGLLVLALVSAGCGGDDDGDEAADTTAPVETTEATSATGGTSTPSSSTSAVTGTTLAANEIEAEAIATLEEIQSTEMVLEAAAAVENVDAFLALMNEAGLLTELRGSGPYTLFLPSNSGLATTFNEEQQEVMAEDENQEVLRTIVRYHVVPREVPKADFREGAELETLVQDTLTLTVQDGTWAVNAEGQITQSVRADQGVVHVIDTALVPPGVECC